MISIRRYGSSLENSKEYQGWGSWADLAACPSVAVQANCNGNTVYVFENKDGTLGVNVFTADLRKLLSYNEGSE